VQLVGCILIKLIKIFLDVVVLLTDTHNCCPDTSSSSCFQTRVIATKRLTKAACQLATYKHYQLTATSKAALGQLQMHGQSAVHYRLHNSPTLDPVNPVNCFNSHL